MKNFDYIRPKSIPEAIAAVAEPGAAYRAAGTNLLDLMKGGVTDPTRAQYRGGQTCSSPLRPRGLP